MALALGLGLAVACSHARAQARDDGPPFLVVDLHTHAFNLRHMPLRGVLQSYGVPSLLARLVEWILLEFTEDDPELDGGSPVASHPELPDDLAPLDLHEAATSVADWVARRVEADRRRRPPRPRAKVVSPFMDRTLLRVLDRLPPVEVERLFPDPAVREWFDPFRHRLTGEEGLQRSWNHRRGFVAALDRGSYRSLVKRTLERAFGAGDRRRARRGRSDRWDTLVHNLGFFHLLQLSEQTLAERIFELMPRVGLAVHQNVDLALRYRGRPDLSFPRVVARRHRLVQASKGRVLRFAPFDPIRGDGLAWVRAELDEHLAAGVKIYPPSGFLPLGNRSRRLEGRLRALYDLCVARDLPIFTHCNDGGFEARTGNGERFAVPERWIPVLERWPRLRLALGHAGEYEGWYTEPRPDGEDWDFLRSRAGIVYRLCVEYPNVYADFGYHGEVLDPARAATLARRLEWCLRRHPGFARKICYGSDYPMVSRVPGYRDFLAAFWRLFRDSPALAPHARDFFRDNALRYLDLPRYLERQGSRLEPSARRYLEKFARTLGRNGTAGTGVPGTLPAAP